MSKLLFNTIDYNRLATLLFFLTLAHVTSAEENIALLLEANYGRIAFCTPSIVDELQIIGEPRKLSPEEARKLGTIFGSEETFFERLRDGTTRGLKSMCIPHWDFKIVLISEESDAYATIRVCTSCEQVMMRINDTKIELPNMRSSAFQELSNLLDIWFPGWAKVSQENKQRWEDKLDQW